MEQAPSTTLSKVEKSSEPDGLAFSKAFDNPLSLENIIAVTKLEGDKKIFEGGRKLTEIGCRA